MMIIIEHGAAPDGADLVSINQNGSPILAYSDGSDGRYAWLVDEAKIPHTIEQLQRLSNNPDVSRSRMAKHFLQSIDDLGLSSQV